MCFAVCMFLQKCGYAIYLSIELYWLIVHTGIVWAWNEIMSQQALIVDCECDHKQVSQKVVTVSVNNSVARSIVHATNNFLFINFYGMTKIQCKETKIYYWCQCLS